MIILEYRQIPEYNKAEEVHMVFSSKKGVIYLLFFIFFSGLGHSVLDTGGNDGLRNNVKNCRAH